MSMIKMMPMTPIAAVTVSITVAAEPAAKATQQEDDEDDDKYKSDRHDLPLVAAPNRPLRSSRSNCQLKREQKSFHYSMSHRKQNVPSFGVRLLENQSAVLKRESCFSPLLASFVPISGLSYKTTFNNELWISSFPLYLM